MTMKISEPVVRYKAPTMAKRRASRVADRVSVRLKPDLAKRLAQAKQEQGVNVTQIIEEALEKHLPVTVRKPKLTLLEALAKRGLLGSVNLPPDGSVNYKKHIGEYLDQKYAHHLPRG